MKEIMRNVICLIVGYIVLWYAGAMFNFFPFSGGDLTIGAVGFTGLLLVVAVVICACWVLEAIEKKNR